MGDISAILESDGNVEVPLQALMYMCVMGEARSVTIGLINSTEICLLDEKENLHSKSKKSEYKYVL